MPTRFYDLEFEERPGYLIAHVKAKFVDLEIATHYINAVMNRFRESEHSKLLFIRDVENVVTENHIAIVTSIVANMLPEGRKFAVCAKPPALDAIRSAIEKERRSKPRNIAAFETIDEAENWLLSD